MSSTTRWLLLILPILLSAMALTAYTSVVTEGLSFGQTLVDDHEIWKKPHNSHILTKTDPYRFFLMFFCKVLGANPAQAESILPQILSGEVTV